jgi:hypothetical protein
MNITEFHETYFADKHRNSTYKKIIAQQEYLVKNKMIKVIPSEKENGYDTRVILKEQETYDFIKKIRLL